jgi:hypothetical protein
MSTIQAITYEDGASITVSDSTPDPAGPFAGFMCGGTAGTAVVVTVVGTVLNLGTINAGVIYPIAIKQVHATNTTATGLVGLRVPPYNGPKF